MKPDEFEARMFRRMNIALVVVVLACALSLVKCHAESGYATWYGEDYRGHTMANGLPFNPDALTCACYGYPLRTVLRVRTELGRTVYVVVTDRGPSSRMIARGIIIDLSRHAFELLATLDHGPLRVRISRAQ